MLKKLMIFMLLTVMPTTLLAQSKIIDIHPNLVISEQSENIDNKPWIFVKHYRLSNGVIISNCYKIPMKYRSFDIQHTHLRCADKGDFYVK